MKKLWTDTWASLSDFRMEPDFIVADANGGAASFTMSGRHTGDFPGYPATGNSFSLKGASVTRVKMAKLNDLIASGPPLQIRIARTFPLAQAAAAQEALKAHRIGKIVLSVPQA